MLNLGNVAFDACQRIKNTDDWKAICDALRDKMTALMHQAVESGTPDNCGYARGVRDVLWAFEVMEAGPNAPSRATMKPALNKSFERVR